jgi:hypothetical protein
MLRFRCRVARVLFIQFCGLAWPRPPLSRLRVLAGSLAAPGLGPFRRWRLPRPRPTSRRCQSGAQLAAAACWLRAPFLTFDMWNFCWCAPQVHQGAKPGTTTLHYTTLDYTTLHYNTLPTVGNRPTGQLPTVGQALGGALGVPLPSFGHLWGPLGGALGPFWQLPTVGN